MGVFWNKRCPVAPPRRGQIVQRVLVDGWSAAQAADAFGVRERQVVRWVAAYRRDGMASLRDAAAAEPMPRAWVMRAQRWLHHLSGQLSAGLTGSFGDSRPASCIELPLRSDERGRRG